MPDPELILRTRNLRDPFGDLRNARLLSALSQAKPLLSETSTRREQRKLDGLSPGGA